MRRKDKRIEYIFDKLPFLWFIMSLTKVIELVLLFNKEFDCLLKEDTK